MKILDLSQDIVKTISFANPYNIGYVNWNSLPKITTLDKVCSRNGKCGTSIALGTVQDIEDIISSKHNTSAISSFKKVYFDKLCTYPRFKLSEKTNIKRSLKPTNVDSCIISKQKFEEHSWWESYVRYNTLIAYALSTNTYYIITSMSDMGYKAVRDFLSTELSIIPGVNNQHKLLNKLIAINKLPSDTIVYYEGRMIYLSDSQTEFINNIQNVYMKITYDTELDAFINANLEALKGDEAKEIDKMLKSTDKTVVGVGMKLLSNYDANAYQCTLAILIISNWSNIIDNSVYKSTGFKQVLKSIGLDGYSHHWSTPDEAILNDLYKTSTNVADKSYCKEIVIAKLKEKFRAWKQSYIEKFNDLELNVSISIE